MTKLISFPPTNLEIKHAANMANYNRHRTKTGEKFLTATILLLLTL